MLLAEIRKGNIKALARAISLVESESVLGDELVSEIESGPSEANARLIGVTGLPGAGKSSLISLLVDRYLERSDKIGVIAVDPSSPVHGGAILGDRIRLMRHATNPRVVIRSMASRGSLGGLSASVSGVAAVMKEGGCDTIIIETVGVGQLGWDILELVDVVATVTAPGLGDEIQLMKSGVLDVTDILVMNKSDLSSAEAALATLRAEVEHRSLRLVSTSAANEEGVSEFVDSLEEILEASESNASYRSSRDEEIRVEKASRYASRLLKPFIQMELSASGSKRDPADIARAALVRWANDSANPSADQKDS